MDSSEVVFQTELDKQRAKLIKALEQGRKIENLTVAPEWEFFEGWLNAAKDKLQKQVNSKVFVNDHNGYLDARAGIAAIEMVLNGVGDFKKAFVRSGKALNELDKMT